MPKPRTVNAVQEYLIDGNPWRVEEFRSFHSALSVTPEHMPYFHVWATTQPHLAIAWQIARMLYGIDPLIPDQTGNADAFGRLYSIDEIAATLQQDESAIDSELDLLRQSWERYAKTIPNDPKPAPKKVAQPSKQQTEQAPAPEPPAAIPSLSPSRTTPTDVTPLTKEEEELIRSRGFALNIFDYGEHRNDDEYHAERRWFHDRLLELRKVFDEPMAKMLARQAVINELHLRRCDDQLVRLSIVSKQFEALHETKQNIETVYQKQWEQIEGICPYVKGSVNKMTFVGVISDIIKGHQDFYANDDKRIIDGFMTSLEIQVELRESQQAGPRYRPGLVAAINEAKAGLFDPKFRRSITNRQCRTLDLALQKANEVLVEKEGVKLPDLLKDGPDGEYPDLVAPSTLLQQVEVDVEEILQEVTDEPIVPPENAVNLEGDEPTEPNEPSAS